MTLVIGVLFLKSGILTLQRGDESKSGVQLFPFVTKVPGVTPIKRKSVIGQRGASESVLRVIKTIKYSLKLQSEVLAVLALALETILKVLTARTLSCSRNAPEISLVRMTWETRSSIR